MRDPVSSADDPGSPPVSGLCPHPAGAAGQHGAVPLAGGAAALPAAQRGREGLSAQGAGVRQARPGAGDPEPPAAGNGLACSVQWLFVTDTDL